jgi:hypothetical protein
MALSTRARVASVTFGWPFETRDTVCDETPARRATSAIEGRGVLARLLAVLVMLPPRVVSAVRLGHSAGADSMPA